jgi:hypothetical protein
VGAVRGPGGPCPPFVGARLAAHRFVGPAPGRRFPPVGYTARMIAGTGRARVFTFARPAANSGCQPPGRCPAHSRGRRARAGPLRPRGRPEPHRQPGTDHDPATATGPADAGITKPSREYQEGLVIPGAELADSLFPRAEHVPGWGPGPPQRSSPGTGPCLAGARGGAAASPRRSLAPSRRCKNAAAPPSRCQRSHQSFTSC